MMASANEKSPLLSNHGNQEPGLTKLKSAVTGFQSEDDNLSSVSANDQPEENKKQGFLSLKFKGRNSKPRLSDAEENKPRTAVDSKRRKPFHYSSVPTYLTGGGNIEHAVDAKTEATFNRYRYYSRLAGSPSQHSKALEIPDHILPPFLLSVELPFKDKEGKQNSIVTIFSIWNTMMGTSLLSMPWAIQQSGFLMGIFLLIVMAGVTLYTCYRVVKSVQKLESGGKLLEFSDVCRAYLGKMGEYTAIFFSLAALLGAMVVYWVLMSNFMFSSIRFIYERAMGLESSENGSSIICAIIDEDVNMTVISDSTDVFARAWSKTHTVPLYLAVLILPLMNFKSPTFFTKFNALGTLSVLFLIIFVSVETVKFGGFHLDFQNPTSVNYAAQLSSHFPAFTGLLSMGFFIHNAIASILRSQQHPDKNIIAFWNEIFHGIFSTINTFVPIASWRFPTFSGILALGYFIHMCISSILRTQINPQNNGRDMTIAYILVAVTYTFVGVMFYSAFPLKKDCLADNLLDNFPHGDVLAFTARLFLLFQMVTLFPLLVFIFRIQCLDPLFGCAYPSWKHVLGLNVILLAIAVLFAVFLPKIGTIIRFSGAFCGLAYIFTLPCLVYMLELKQQNQLTWPIIIVHICIIALGAANFIAQFVLLAF